MKLIKNNINYKKLNKRIHKRTFLQRLRRNTIFKRLFLEYVDRGNNGVVGPGYANYSYYKVSFGKLAFMISIVVLITVFIMRFS